MDGLITSLSQFGIPGFLALIAYIFWNKWCHAARFSLVCAVLGAVATLVLQLWPARYELRITPPPEPSWGGLYATGTTVDKIEVVILRNDEEYERQVIGPLEVATRQLDLQYRSDSQQAVVRFNENPQGVIPYRTLERNGWSHSTDTVQIRTVALSEPVNDTGDCASVLPDSVARDEFADLRVVVNEWRFHEIGVEVTVYSDSTALTRGVLTRNNEISIDHNGTTTFIKIIHLGFENPGDASNFVQFLFIRKA